MNRIAEAECATCHRIRPKTEMRPVRVRRKSGSSFGFWHSARTGNSNSRSQRTGESYHASYAHQEMWVCKGCKKPRSDWTPAHYAFLLILALLAWIILSPSSRTDDGTGQEKSNVPAPETDNDRRTDDQDVPPRGETSDPSPEEQKSPSPAPHPEIPDAPYRFDAPQILDAQIKAVSAGRPIRWRAGRHTGYAVPSEVTVGPDTGIQCRNVYATLDGSNQQSTVVRMCQSPTGAWVQG